MKSITEAVGKRGQHIDTLAVGYWLRKHVGERIDGLWFERDGEIRGSAAYVLRLRPEGVRVIEEVSEPL